MREAFLCQAVSGGADNGDHEEALLSIAYFPAGAGWRGNIQLSDRRLGSERH